MPTNSVPPEHHILRLCFSELQDNEQPTILSFVLSVKDKEDPLRPAHLSCVWCEHQSLANFSKASFPNDPNYNKSLKKQLRMGQKTITDAVFLLMNVQKIKNISACKDVQHLPLGHSLAHAGIIGDFFVPSLKTHIQIMRAIEQQAAGFYFK